MFGFETVDIDNRVGTVLADVCQSNVSVHVGLTVPEVTEEGIRRSRTLCQENRCGNYGRSWTCPPMCDPPNVCASAVAGFSRCALIHRRYSARLNDPDRLDSVIQGFQEILRSAKGALEMNGIDCLVLGGGPCRYCFECTAAYGSPCRFPDKRIPSVSVYDVNINLLMELNGISVKDPEGTVTMYGVVLY